MQDGLLSDQGLTHFVAVVIRDDEHSRGKKNENQMPDNRSSLLMHYIAPPLGNRMLSSRIADVGYVPPHADRENPRRLCSVQTRQVPNY